MNHPALQQYVNILAPYLTSEVKKKLTIAFVPQVKEGVEIRLITLQCIVSVASSLFFQRNVLIEDLKNCQGKRYDFASGILRDSPLHGALLILGPYLLASGISLENQIGSESEPF